MEKGVYKGYSDDVTTEPYKGPSTAVAAAGEGSLAHFGLGLAGLIIGFVAALIKHKELGEFINTRRMKAMELFLSADKNEQSWGKFLLGIFGHKEQGALTGLIKESGNPRLEKLAVEELKRSEKGWLYSISDEIRKIPGIKQLLSLLGTDKESLKKVDTAIMGGGILGAFGFFIAPIAFWITGAKHANEGKHQFNRAKEEIHTIRQQYDSLREKYVETTAQLEEHKANKAAATVQDATPPREEISMPKRQDIPTPDSVVTSVAREAAMVAPQPSTSVNA